MKSTSIPPANPDVDIMSNHYHTVASRHHGFPPFRWEEKDHNWVTVCHHIDNIQKIKDTNLVKHDIIFTIPYQARQS
jgi:hypothetical protein